MSSIGSGNWMSSSDDCSDKCLQHEASTPILEYGVIFCLTGQEKNVAERLNMVYPMIRALSPVKLRYRRSGGLAREERITLFPGYVFLEVSECINASRLSKEPGVIKLLYTSNLNWQLSGQDRNMVEYFFKNDGVVGFSKAYFDEGNRIHILSGFLKDFEGQIVRVDRRLKTAEICVSINGMRIKQWLGFEEIKM